MGAYDSARVCELVGSFLLYALSLKYNKTNIGLYRNEMLLEMFLEMLACLQFEKIKKAFQKLFR